MFYDSPSFSSTGYTDGSPFRSNAIIDFDVEYGWSFPDNLTSGEISFELSTPLQKERSEQQALMKEPPTTALGITQEAPMSTQGLLITIANPGQNENLIVSMHASFPVQQTRENSDETITCDRPGCENIMFGRKHEWRKHTNKHTRPFKCTVTGCEQSFARKADLQRHEDAVHRQEERYFCPVVTCERTLAGLSRKDYLEQHARMHAKRSEPSSASEELEQMDEESNAIVAQGIPEVPLPRPQKRWRGVVVLAQRKEQDGPVDELETEIQQLKRTVSELTNEKKRLQDQVEKQTDIIYSLACRND